MQRAIAILNSVQLEVLKAKVSKKLPTILTVGWAVEAVAYLGGSARTSSEDFYWHPSSGAWLVKITRPL